MSNKFLKNFHVCFFGVYNPVHRDAPPSQHDEPPSPPLIKTFNTLYDFTSESTSNSFIFSSSSDDSSESTEYQPIPPDFATVFASQRFFFSSPGHSNSIVESSTHVSGGVAVNTYSPDPVADFRRSMQEMIEARGYDNNNYNKNNNSEYLHELLSCYLRLNSKKNHKYVITAFTDILVHLLSDCRKMPQTRRRLML